MRMEISVAVSITDLHMHCSHSAPAPVVPELSDETDTRHFDDMDDDDKPHETFPVPKARLH